MPRRSPSPLQRLTTSEPDDPGATRLLDGALQTFIDLGIKRASMGDVAQRARSSPATLYRKFASKSGLVEAVGMYEARRILREIDKQMEELRTSGADLETQATELLLAAMHHMREHPLFQRLVRTEPELVLPFFTTNGDTVLTLGRDYLAAQIRRFQADGLLPEYDPTPIAEVLARLAVSLTLTRPTVIPLTNHDKTRAFVRDFLLPSLKAGSPT